jgi:two-component system sensor histidine kinase ChiS
MKTLKVLVVDDDPMTCNLLETILQLENYQTSSIHTINDNGIIPLLEQTNPDIVILDFHLGSQETLECVVEIRGNEVWRQLPILMTSAIDHSQASLEAGANDFILKPYNWQDMTKRINNIRDNFVYQEA